MPHQQIDQPASSLTTPAPTPSSHRIQRIHWLKFIYHNRFYRSEKRIGFAGFPGHATLLSIIYLVLVMSISTSDSAASSTANTPKGQSPQEPPPQEQLIPQASDCPVIVETALQITEESCHDTGRNTVCYGHFFLDASPYAGITQPLDFDSPGDIEDLNALRSLRLSAMDESAGSWGVALMQVEAALEEAVTQITDVTFVMFGDVTLDSSVPIIGVQSAQNLNVRRFPSESSFIIGSVPPQTTLAANGRLGDSSWVRVRFNTDADAIGWVSGDLISSTGEINTLAVVEPETGDLPLVESLAYGPMQMFYLESGIQDAPCDAAPESGMLIQTPEGTAEVTLLMNEIDIKLRATAYFQAQPNGNMEVFVLDGAATVESGGESRVLAAGTTLQVPLDAAGLAAGIPTDPQPYDTADVQALPTNLLQIPVTVPPPLDNPAGAPLPGTWHFAWGVDELTCDNGEVVKFRVDDPAISIAIAADGSSITTSQALYNRVETGVYEGIFLDTTGNTHRYTLTVTALDRIEGQAQINYIDVGCTLNVPFNIRLVQPAA